jgi:hypothetical protein
MNPINERETLEAQLDDLATGQLGLWAAWRLRRRIARDHELARTYAEICQLRTELRTLSPALSRKPSPTRLVGTFTIGGLTLKTRTALLATGSLMFLSVTGALAAHYLVRPDLDMRIGSNNVTDKKGLWIHGSFRGNIVIRSTTGQQLYAAPWQGTSPTNSVTIRTMNDDKVVASGTLKGMGTHMIQDSQGKIVAYAVLSPFSPADLQKMAAENEAVDKDFEDYYRHPERVTPSDAKRGFADLVAMPGMVGGYFTHDFVHNNESMGASTGGSWKVYGAVRVRAVFYDKPRTIKHTGDIMADPKTGKVLSDTSFHVTLPAKAIVQEGSSRTPPSADELAWQSPLEQKMSAEFSAARPVPEAYWTIADPEADLDHQTGYWKHVLRSGTFTGYGHHVVNDETGKPLMTLDISPLTPLKPTR